MLKSILKIKHEAKHHGLKPKEVFIKTGIQYNDDILISLFRSNWKNCSFGNPVWMVLTKRKHYEFYFEWNISSLMFAWHFWELTCSPGDSQCPYSPLCIRNTTSKQVLSVMGFLRFSSNYKINLKKKNPDQNKAWGNHKTLAQKNYQECTTLPA